MPHAITQFPQLRQQLPKLQALGIETLEQLQASSQVAALEMRTYLGTDVDSLRRRAGWTAPEREWAMGRPRP
jgi:hypothetical protein